MIKTVILTVSSTRIKENDLSGRAIQKMLDPDIFEIIQHDIVQDNMVLIKRKLIHYADKLKAELVLTTGGTGLGPLDMTPEATIKIIEKQVPGIPELIRRKGMEKTSRAILSRGTAGIRKGTLIINLPGSPKGAQESLEAVLDIIPHSMDMLKGKGH